MLVPAPSPIAALAPRDGESVIPFRAKRAQETPLPHPELGNGSAAFSARTSVDGTDGIAAMLPDAGDYPEDTDGETEREREREDDDDERDETDRPDEPAGRRVDLRRKTSGHAGSSQRALSPPAS